MSDPRSDSPSTSMALTHAREVAHWIALLLGWLCLGEQGTQMGWSWASGVLAVALWWSVRLLCRGSAWALRCSPWVMGLLGLITVWGLYGLKSPMAQPWAHGLLLGLAVLWGLWSALIETRSQVSTFQLGPVAWHPVLAAGLVALSWQWPAAEPRMHLGVLALLALCACVLYANDRLAAVPHAACRGQRASLDTLLAPSSMGLMMGSLWLTNAWCASWGWSQEQMVGLHLALMAGLPTVTALLTKPWPASPAREVVLSLSLLILGALMLLGDSVLHGVLAMLLPSLAWAVHCSRHRTPLGPAQRLAPWVNRSLALLLGPVLLVWVGAESPTQGPWAIQSALALLGVLAAWQLVFLGWRKHGWHMPFSAT